MLNPADIPALYKKYGSLKAAVRETGESWRTVNTAYKRAVEAGLMQPLTLGRKTHQALKPVARVRVIKAKRRRHHTYIFTCAQNNTKVHASFASLETYAKHLGAELHVSTFLYIRSYGNTKLDKKGAGKASDLWYDPKVVPYISNARLQVAHGLVWCGEGNTSPTAASPLTSMEVYTGRESMIYPHTRQEAEPIATMERGQAKLNYTTGTCTLRNYIQRKAGLIAEFFHTYGGVIVEADEDGHWWVRQLHASNDGTIYDWDKKITPDGKVIDYLKKGERPLALVAGDVHVANIDEAVRDATWKKGGLVDQLRPQYQFIHDVFDGYARSHHTAKNPYKLLVRHFTKRESVQDELYGVHSFLEWIARKHTKTIVVNSNHDRHLARWLEENDGRRDPVNAECWSYLNSKIVSYIRETGKEPDALELALCDDPFFLTNANARFLKLGESFVLNEIEFGMHGDAGKNGSRGSLKQFARMGRRSVTGHDHTGGLKGGAAKAGTNSRYDLEYALNGPSSWTQTDVLVYPNGKPALLTFYAGKWRA